MNAAMLAYLQLTHGNLDGAMTFYLGSHMPNWLWSLNVPLFVSCRRLVRLGRIQPATCDWALDSGGYTELQLHGGWSTSPADYVAQVRRYAGELGRLQFAAIQDWVCAPATLAKTGLSVAEHQERTVSSYLALRELAPELPWMPVLQGLEVDDYRRCAERYEAAGVSLRQAPLVGVGSLVGRSPQTIEAVLISLATLRLNLHGFGLKLQALRLCARLLATADSLAWSFDARRAQPLAGCTHANCANCPRYALQWREEVLGAIAIGETTKQMLLPYAA